MTRHRPNARLQRRGVFGTKEERKGEDILFRALPLSRRDVAAAAKSTATLTPLVRSSVRSHLVLFCNKSMNEKSLAGEGHLLLSPTYFLY